MVILGIDTSLGTTVAAIDMDGFVRAHADSSDPLGHAEAIGTLLQRVLTEASTDGVATDATPLTHVAAGMGPGPFTGLRIGIAAARAFALGRGIPVVPVISHDAIALGMLLADPAASAQGTERFAVVTDARRREVACSVYRGIDDDGLPQRISGPELVARDDIDAHLEAAGARRHDAHGVQAALIALVAARALAAGREVGPRDALYLRSPDVSLPGAPKKVGQ